MKNFISFYTEVMSVATRKKMAKRMAKLARRVYTDAKDAGFGDLDYTGIIAHITKLSEK